MATASNTPAQNFNHAADLCKLKATDRGTGAYYTAKLFGRYEVSLGEYADGFACAPIFGCSLSKKIEAFISDKGLRGFKTREELVIALANAER